MIEILCESSPWGKTIDLLVAEMNFERDVVAYGSSITMEKLGPGDMVRGPTLRLDHAAAQRLMDELWRCGLRPLEGTGSAGSLAATERHLKDMQSIAMGLLRGELKGTA